MILLSKSRAKSGFSLIEITLSIGIIAFALVAVLGLLPAGLNSQKDATDQARSAQVLNDLTQAVRGIYPVDGTFRFAPPLETVDVAPGRERSFALMENGTLQDPGVRTLERRGTVFINQRPLSGSAPRAVFISVAWPQTATRTGSTWSQANGSTSAYIYAPK
jgi:type II secretory pathway pseudopilin PulG